MSNLGFCAVTAYNSGYESGLRFALRKIKQHELAEKPIPELIKKIEAELKSLEAT